MSKGRRQGSPGVCIRVQSRGDEEDSLQNNLIHMALHLKQLLLSCNIRSWSLQDKEPNGTTFPRMKKPTWRKIRSLIRENKIDTICNVREGEARVEPELEDKS